MCYHFKDHKNLIVERMIISYHFSNNANILEDNRMHVFPFGGYESCTGLYRKEHRLSPNTYYDKILHLSPSL